MIIPNSIKNPKLESSSDDMKVLLEECIKNSQK